MSWTDTPNLSTEEKLKREAHEHIKGLSTAGACIVRMATAMHIWKHMTEKDQTMANDFLLVSIKECLVAGGLEFAESCAEVMLKYPECKNEKSTAILAFSAEAWAKRHEQFSQNAEKLSDAFEMAYPDYVSRINPDSVK